MSITDLTDADLRHADIELIHREVGGLNMATQITETLERAADSIAAFDTAADRDGSWEAGLADQLATRGMAAIDFDTARLLCALARQWRRGGPFG